MWNRAISQAHTRGDGSDTQGMGSDNDVAQAGPVPGGETTATMRQGGICSYPGAASQLDAAVMFVRTHRGSVKY
jgi:hypothetical protein